MLRVGLKIDYIFDEDRYYKKLYGERDILYFLYKTGIRALETPVGPEMDKEGIVEHINKCMKAGFTLSFHLYSEMGQANPAHFSLESGNICKNFHESIFQLADCAARLQRHESVVNIHPAAEHIKFDRKELVEKSIEFFKWANNWCQTNAPEVKPVAELQIRPNEDEPIQRIGDNYSELLEIAKHADIGTCWDFGHAYMNTQRFGDPLYPPDEFVRYVIHVHCHDASVEDHYPLGFGNVPWEHFLDILKKAGFDGTIILEVIPRNFLSTNGLNSLIDSVNSITRVIHKKPKPTGYS
jgi:sugar phosphate isomerase/epimerase